MAKMVNTLLLTGVILFGLALVAIAPEKIQAFVDIMPTIVMLLGLHMGAVGYGYYDKRRSALEVDIQDKSDDLAGPRQIGFENNATGDVGTQNTAS